MNVNAPVSDYMSYPLYSVQPEDPLKLAQDLFQEHQIHHLLVTEEDRLMGILSYGDLLYLLNRMDNDGFEAYRNQVRLKNYKVNEIMSSKVITLQKDEPLLHALNLFLDKRINALPVMDGDKLVGIITTRDIIKKLVKEAMVKTA
ncbi:MAG: CBS domain-containing protein [Saprospiraceae bacterium]|nr:CBS domain-containing protein [Saprospiraceae bacterium]MCB9319502.1 CBS domain-containing protein [Lewinellaceae bacterium]